MTIDLTNQKSIHIIGIGGAGMSAIATVLIGMGHKVSGSDSAEGAAVARLRDQGATVFIGHDRANVSSSVDVVAHSTAIPSTNPEMASALELGLPILRRAEILQAICRTKKSLAVAGTHGKTTTSTFLAHVLEAGTQCPSWIIGGEIAGKEGGAQWLDGEWFAVEADESDGTFVELDSYGVIVTNVEPDHLEFYGSLDDREGALANLRSTFRKFVSQARGPKVVCADDEGAAALSGLDGVVTYGTDESATYRITDVELGRFSAHFVVAFETERIGVEIHIPGMHNVRNAAAALALGHKLGIPLEVGAVGLAAFRGVGRRFTFRGEHNGITFVDEYAHLPGEVRAALSAARAGGWDRVVAVFQPHRYSRTEQVGHEFTSAFDDADLLVLADVFAAGEPPRPGIDGHVVERAVRSGDRHPPITYVESRDQLAVVVADLLEPGDLCMSIGAGDVTKLSDEILTRLQTH